MTTFQGFPLGAESDCPHIQVGLYSIVPWLTDIFTINIHKTQSNYLWANSYIYIYMCVCKYPNEPGHHLSDQQLLASSKKRKAHSGRVSHAEWWATWLQRHLLNLEWHGEFMSKGHERCDACGALYACGALRLCCNLVCKTYSIYIYNYII